MVRKLLNLLKDRLLSPSQKEASVLLTQAPRTYICEESASFKISKNAVKVIETLRKAGYEAYLVGGGVRDLLVGIAPKDFDIATNAKPEQVKELFKRAQLIGRRFKIVHVCFPYEVIEVTTFRSRVTERSKKDRLYTKQGFLLRDNEYGTIAEDAGRRDFTLNALYYDVMTSSIIDYVGGFRDLKAQVIRVIGHPKERYQEDPLRILRAIRLSAKLSFTIEAETEKPFREMGRLLAHIPAARLLDELLKIYRSGCALKAVHLLKKHQLFKEIFSFVQFLSTQKEQALTERIIEITLKNADIRVQEGNTLSVGLLFSAFLWYPLQNELVANQKTAIDNAYALNSAIHKMLSKSMGMIALTRKIKLIIREIWLLQYFFTKQRPRQVYYALKHRYFRNAYHLLNFRVQAGEAHLKPLFNWWTQFLEADSELQTTLLKKKAMMTEM